MVTLDCYWPYSTKTVHSVVFSLLHCLMLSVSTSVCQLAYLLVSNVCSMSLRLGDCGKWLSLVREIKQRHLVGWANESNCKFDWNYTISYSTALYYTPEQYLTILHKILQLKITFLSKNKWNNTALSAHMEPQLTPPMKVLRELFLTSFDWAALHYSRNVC